MAGTAKDTAYIKLGSGIVPAETSPLTIEVWATQHSVKNWARIFDFGSDQNNNLLMSWSQGTDINKDCVEIKTGGTSIIRVENSMKPYTLNVPYHISMTITPTADGKATLAWAKRDTSTGAILNSGSGTTTAAWDAKVIAGWAWNCLGRSQYADSDADATYDEMRIWKAALTADQLTTSAQLGPDVLPVPADPGITHTLNLTSENGTVSVNGAAGVGTGAVTVPWSAGLRLTAVPAAGCTFCRWEGDTQYISSGTVTSPEITIGTAQDITLTAVFDTAVAVYARYANGGFNYLSMGKGPVAAPEGGMNDSITILFSSDAEYQGLKTAPEEVAKAKGLELEADITLTADTDWTALDYSLGGNAIDINGKHFTTGSLSGEGGITSDGNIVANGDFQANAIADGAAVVMTPNGWKISGTVSLIRNEVNDGWYNRNGSNLCRINGGSYIYREFTIVQPGDYNFQFDVSSRSSNGWWANYSAYAQIDGNNVFNQGDLGWTLATKKFTVNLGVGTHTLKIGGGSGTVLFDNVKLYKSNSAATTGVLEVKVPEGKTVTNDTVWLGGGQALQLWKTGAGTLLMNKENKGYGSPWGYVSTIVKEGLLRKSNVVARENCGAQYATIQVDDGGTYDQNGRTYWDYHFILNGNGYDGKGALINTAAASSPWAQGSYGYIYNVTLGSDTTISGTQSFGMSWWNHGANTMTMNGHTVHYGGTLIYFGNMSYAGKGRIVIDRGCTMESYNNRPSAAGCTLEVSGQLQLHDQAMTVSNLIFTATGTFYNGWDSRPVYTVYDTYAPNINTTSGSQTRHPNVALGTATTPYTCLDLSLFTDTFDSSTTTFNAGSSVTVELGSRALVNNQKLISWSAIPNVEFAGRGENLGDFRLLAREDGLYVVEAPTWAVWDLVNECWQYFRSNGEPYAAEWTEGITEKIDVHFSSIEEFNAIKSMGVTPAKFVLTKLELPQGTALYDFTGGFAFTIPPNTVIDLKGNRLKLPPSLIGGVVPFTVTDSTCASAEPADSPAVLQDACFWLDALDKSTMTIDGSGRVTRWTSKDANHVVATATSAPTYKATEYSIPTVDFGAIGSNLDMVYNSFNKLRTVFWVMQIAKGEGAFFLGDSANYNFHRGAAGQYGNGSYHKYASMWNGLSGVDINGATPPDNKFCVYSATMNVDAISDRLTTDRNCTSGGVPRTGGRQLSELICFNTVLSDRDRRAVVLYLQSKWFTGGELIVEVPEGQTIANSNISITGNARLVKTGAGTLGANRAGQSYTGGTKISEGTFTLGNSTCLGANGSEVTVDPDGILEMNGKGDLYNYNFVLAGGILQNTTADVGSSTAQIANMRLTADSTFKPTCNYGFIGSGYAATTLDLAGHTLTVPVGVGKNFWLFNATVTQGTVDLTTGGYLSVDKTAVNAPDTYFRVGCALNIVMPFTVGGYEAVYGADYNSGTAVMTVKNTFKPVSSYYRGVTLADGAKLDLSAFNGILGTQTTFKDAKTPMVYPAGTEEEGNAKLFVELHGRALTSSKIIDWDPATPPAFLDFEVTERTKRDGRMLEIRNDGVYVLGGTVIFFR